MQNSNNIMRKFLAIIAVILSTVLWVAADNNVVRRDPVFVDGVLKRDSIYEDRVQLAVDDEGLDITVNMKFDEGNNQLLVMLKSTRPMIAFAESTIYKKAFTHTWFAGWTGRHLKFHKLSFPTLIEPKTEYYLSNACYKSFAKKRKRHTFNRWIYGSDKAVAIPGSIIPFVTDTLSQIFQLPDSVTTTSITLRNICLATAAPRKNKGPLYRIVAEADLNRTYNIRIQRDPCFGNDALIAAEDTILRQMSESLSFLDEKYKSRLVGNAESLEVFGHHKDLLLTRFPKRTDVSACPEIQMRRDKYNALLDSLASIECAVQIDSSLLQVDMQTGVSAVFVMQHARNIDLNTSIWQNSTDAIQRRDLIRTNKRLIAEVYDAIQENGIVTDKQRLVVENFKRAEEYFYKVCKL